MNRTFHYRSTWVSYLAVIIVAAAALFFLWNRTTANAVIGFALMIATLLMVERIVHTVYVFTSDGMLVIDRGRLSRQTVVRVGDITRVETVRHKLLPVRFVALEYGAGHIIAVQPVDEEAFVRELKRRQEAVEKQ